MIRRGHDLLRKYDLLQKIIGGTVVRPLTVVTVQLVTRHSELYLRSEFKYNQCIQLRDPSWLLQYSSLRRTSWDYKVNFSCSS